MAAVEHFAHWAGTVELKVQLKRKQRLDNNFCGQRVKKSSGRYRPVKGGARAGRLF
jgi:hypothetical protein